MLKEDLVNALNSLLASDEVKNYKVSALSEIVKAQALGAKLDNALFIVDQYPDYPNIRIKLSDDEYFTIDFRFNRQILKAHPEDVETFADFLLPIINEYNIKFIENKLIVPNTEGDE